MRTPRTATDQRHTGPAALRRRAQRPAAPGRTSEPPAGPRDAERAARAAGGPDDTARYDCPCGHAFRSPVTASVQCPRCGTTQAW